MKHSLHCILISLLVAANATAQVTLTDASFPKSGDTLLSAVDNMPTGIELGAAEPDRSWDFTTLEAPFSRSAVVVPATQLQGAFAFPAADFGISNNGTNTFYQVSDEAVLILGFYGQDPAGLGLENAFRYNPPLQEQHAPLSYGDAPINSSSNISIALSTENLPSEILNELPITPDSIRLRLSQDRRDEVDAWGLLTLPGGIYDVLREKRVDQRELRVDVRLGAFPWTDITDILINQVGLEEVGRDTVTSYRFLSPEAVQPVAQVFVNEEQEVQRVRFKVNEAITNLQRIDKPVPSVYAFPNPAIVNVRFEFTNLPQDAYTLRIFNILGIEEWSRRYKLAGNFTEKVNISSLSKGTYLYSLSNSQGKTLVTRRLIVVRP